MTLTDEEFREAHQPLHIPSRYDRADSGEHKIIFALASLGEGTVTDVIGELEKLEPGLINAPMADRVKGVLTGLFDQGLLTGHDEHGIMYYNFHKITQANDGSVNPQLLAPGLD